MLHAPLHATEAPHEPSVLESLDPATGEAVWQGEETDPAAQIALVAHHWTAWAGLSSAVRIETMRRFANGVRASEEAFATLISRETGRPLWSTRQEVISLFERVEKAVQAYSERTGQRQSEGAMGARTALRHKPHGVLAIITPHCLPARIPVDHMVPALLAGNGVLFKPSEKVPATGEMLVRLMHEAGVPHDQVQCVIGGPAVGEALAAAPDVHGVLFTGSTRTGRAINRACADQPGKMLALEMSGNNPIIAWDTPDIASAAALIVQSAFDMSGQHCLSARRLIVRDTLAEPLLGAVKALTDRLIVGPPTADPPPFMGPVIDMDAADGLTESFLYLMSHGGRPIRHMQRPVEGLPFVTPGIIDVTAMTPRSDVELFGPILQVICVTSFDEAIIEANSTRHGLSATLIGGGPEHYDRFWANSRAGIVNWNRPTYALAANAPVGGTGLSGNHRPGGHYMADHCAYPVASSEMPQPRATIGVGLRAIVADR
ncbi:MULTISPECIES: succinylglutamate-semialdehyde dehydrogenase [unclassified Sphingobium]|uniref:succinylglutamate-semialdehyde dehydrogenase n=1 Tax=unclassified Sphingobium TaxID=2611147 RepID=UPI0022257C96|nr:MULTISPECIES: succinylglutamate-semialdehyde dehydrogenase [unclassified Sphingobium]MCW2411072.1 succinylglutamic semialdehyde dehydrogenase [Sphingobium sp. B8D3D]MCW2416636.1 succinylglutamic semialdehyde dehydrogenase [Sphingobium sp. B8D3A]